MGRDSSCIDSGNGVCDVCRYEPGEPEKVMCIEPYARQQCGEQGMNSVVLAGG